MHGELTKAEVNFNMVAINRPGYTVTSKNLCPATQKFPVLQDVEDSKDGATVWSKFAGRAAPYCNDCTLLISSLFFHCLSVRQRQLLTATASTTAGTWIFYPNHTLYRAYGVINFLETENYNTVKSHLMLASKNRGFDADSLGPLFTRTDYPIEFGAVKAAVATATKAEAAAAPARLAPDARAVLMFTMSVLLAIMSCLVA